MAHSAARPKGHAAIADVTVGRCETREPLTRGCISAALNVQPRAEACRAFSACVGAKDGGTPLLRQVNRYGGGIFDGLTHVHFKLFFTGADSGNREK